MSSNQQTVAFSAIIIWADIWPTISVGVISNVIRGNWGFVDSTQAKNVAVFIFYKLSLLQFCAPISHVWPTTVENVKSVFCFKLNGVPPIVDLKESMPDTLTAPRLRWHMGQNILLKLDFLVFEVDRKSSPRVPDFSWTNFQRNLSANASKSTLQFGYLF